MKPTPHLRLLLSICLTPAVLFALLALYSLLVSWKILSLSIFWFLIIPAATIHVPRLLKSTPHVLFGQILGLVLFYGLMHFMIYEHSHTDYYKLMMVSCVFNLIVISLFRMDNALQKRIRELDSAKG